MENTERLLLLMNLEKELKYTQYDKLGLINIDRLRSEVEIEIEKLKNELLIHQPVGSLLKSVISREK
jgi:hypothetical protein